MRATPLAPMAVWVPGSSDYVAAHQYVRYVRGAPQECEQDERHVGTLHWANVTGRYHDPSDFRALCVPCHRAMDRPATCRRGHPLPIRGRCRTCRNASKMAAYRRLVSSVAGRLWWRERCRVNQRRWRGRVVSP